MTFESPKRLTGEVTGVLEAIRGVTEGRYACLMEGRGILFESAAPGEAEAAALRRLLEQRSAALFAIPARLASGGPMEDVFEGWDRDEFLLGFINGRVAVVVACPQAERARPSAFDLLRVLADLLFRLDPRYRLDPQGRGLLFGRARIDLIAVGTSSA